MKKIFLLTVILMAVTMLQAATNRTWTGGGDGINWGDSANWSGGVPDADSRYILIRNGSIVADSVSAATSENLHLAGDSGRVGDEATLTFNSGTLDLGKRMFVGYINTNTGNLIMNGGTINQKTDDTLGIVFGNGGTGNLTMNGGLIDANYMRTSGTAGSDGGSEILLTGGELRPGRLYLGSASNNSADSMVVDNGGWLNCTNFMRIGELGSAVMTVKDGGTASVLNVLTLGYSGGSSGILNMEGGTFEVGSLVVGRYGTGEVNLTGGSLQTDALLMDTEAVMDIAGGELLLLGNITDITTYGNVLAYSGLGSFVYDYDAGSNYTTISAVPEPATLALLGLGALAIRRRRKS